MTAVSEFSDFIQMLSFNWLKQGSIKNCIEHLQIYAREHPDPVRLSDFAEGWFACERDVPQEVLDYIKSEEWRCNDEAQRIN